MIENLKVFLSQIDHLSECVDMTTKIQHLPYSEESAKDVTEGLGIIKKIVDHIHIQLEKGIAIEGDLDTLAEETRQMTGAQIYVAPYIQVVGFTIPDKTKSSHFKGN